MNVMKSMFPLYEASFLASSQTPMNTMTVGLRSLWMNWVYRQISFKITLTNTTMCYSPTSTTLLARCDASRTLPSLQHDFCDLWNDMVREVRERSDSLSISILRDVYHIYIALHEDSLPFPKPFSYTADHHAVLSSYPPCNIAAHRSQP